LLPEIEAWSFGTHPEAVKLFTQIQHLLKKIFSALRVLFTPRVWGGVKLYKLFDKNLNVK
jgi:hypothetical protein